jgi:hypothetical protein
MSDPKEDSERNMRSIPRYDFDEVSNEPLIMGMGLVLAAGEGPERCQTGGCKGRTQYSPLIGCKFMAQNTTVYNAIYMLSNGILSSGIACVLVVAERGRNGPDPGLVT